MKDLAVADRYAKALFEAAMAAKQGKKVGEELAAFSQRLRENPAFSRALNHPLLSGDQKKELARKELKSISPLFGRFLETVLSRKRAALLPAIAGLYEELMDEAQGLQAAQVTSAAPLSKSQQEALQDRLSRAWGAPVKLTARVDKSILGGLVLRQKDSVWDRSLRGQLERLSASLLEAAKS